MESFGFTDCVTTALIGMGTVFVGLICLVGICKLLGIICSKFKGEEPAKKEASLPASASNDIPDRAEFIAAVSAAIAEELGEDVSAIRITSVRRI